MYQPPGMRRRGRRGRRGHKKMESRQPGWNYFEQLLLLRLHRLKVSQRIVEVLLLASLVALSSKLLETVVVVAVAVGGIRCKA